MKRKAKLVSAVTAIAVLWALVAAAQEVNGKAPGEGSGQKDICLIYPEQCHYSIDTIQERIDRLNREIAKGTAVYTEDELSRLAVQLRDAKRVWSYMNGDRPAISE